MLDRVQLQLNQNDIILRPSQHGFTSGRSTTSALISITQPWFNATDNTCRDKAGIHAFFIDFKKAFDPVDDGILLNKLALLNVKEFHRSRVAQLEYHTNVPEDLEKLLVALFSELKDIIV
ncbi:Hypothetical predicted protein, partial [Paramuricea clavata]